MKEASNAGVVSDRDDYLAAKKAGDEALDSGDGHGFWQSIVRRDSIVRKYGPRGALAFLAFTAYLMTGPV